MGKWMVFFKGYFRLIAAVNIEAATEIGQEIALREDCILLGTAPYMEG